MRLARPGETGPTRCKPPAVGWTEGLRGTDTGGMCRVPSSQGVRLLESGGVAGCGPAPVPPRDESGAFDAVVESIGARPRRLEGPAELLSASPCTRPDRGPRALPAAARTSCRSTVEQGVVRA